MTRPKFAESPDDLMPLQQALQLSGLEFMQGILAGEYPAPPISKTLNFDLHDVQFGQVVFYGAPQFDAFNPLGTVHGGWYGTVLDSAMACAVMTTVPKGKYYTTLEYKINIVRPIPLGRRVRSIGTVDHSGRSTVVAQGRIEDVETSKLYATGTTTCIILDAPTA